MCRSTADGGRRCPGHHHHASTTTRSTTTRAGTPRAAGAARLATPEPVTGPTGPTGRGTDRLGGPIRAWADIPGDDCATDAETRAYLVARIAELDAAGGIVAPGAGGAEWAHLRNELRRLEHRRAADPVGFQGYTDGTI